MADFERRQLEFRLEFMRWSSDERNNFSEGSSKPKKDVQVLRVRGAAAPRVFELELLVSLWVTFQVQQTCHACHEFSIMSLLLGDIPVQLVSL